MLSPSGLLFGGKLLSDGKPSKPYKKDLSTEKGRIRDLRQQTGLGIGECKRALKESNGDLLGAIEVLKRYGAKNG